MADKTSHDILARIALIPRTMEARGLDASPTLRQKLAQAGDLPKRILRAVPGGLQANLMAAALRNSIHGIAERRLQLRFIGEVLSLAFIRKDAPFCGRGTAEHGSR